MSPEARSRTRRAAESIAHHAKWLRPDLGLALVREAVVVGLRLGGPEGLLFAEHMKLAVRELEER